MGDNAIIVCSGGLDSVIAAYYVKKELKPEKMELIFFDYGQKPLKEEKACVEKLAKDLNAGLKVIDLKWLGEISGSLINKKGDVPETTKEDLGDLKGQKEERILWWVPCRNALFLLGALAHAESLFISTGERYVIYSGIKKEGNVNLKDTTPEFVKKINELAEEATFHGGYKIETPLMEYDKDEEVKLGEKLDVPWEWTYSCYVGKGFDKNGIPIHCGKCANCMLRKTGFYWSDNRDKSIYEN
jgi:7-cyano-7-deazaguanine synthase